MKEYIISDKEKELLRRLAAQVARISQSSIMQERISNWTAHNDLKTDYPMIHIEPQNGWRECIPADTLKCEHEIARKWEMTLRKQIFGAETLKDDKVIEPYFDVPYIYHNTGWGIESKQIRSGTRGSYIVIPGLKDYEKDFQKLRCPEIIIEWEESDRLLELAHEMFDGILTVRRKMERWIWIYKRYPFIREGGPGTYQRYVGAE